MEAILKPKPEELIRKTFARFTDQEIVPKAREMDEAEQFPRWMFEKIAKTGAYGIRYPRSVGGAGGNTVQFCTMVEELARGSLSVAAFTAMQCLMGTNFLFEYGNPEQHERLLKPAIRGEKVASFALTEADAATDLAGVKTSARKDGDSWIVNGSKTWITNAPVADFFTVLCQTDKSKGLRGLNFFLIERDTPGLYVSKKFDKLGTRATEISELAFTDVTCTSGEQAGERGTRRRQPDADTGGHPGNDRRFVFGTGTGRVRPVETLCSGTDPVWEKNRELSTDSAEDRQYGDGNMGLSLDDLQSGRNDRSRGANSQGSVHGQVLRF